MLAIASTNTTTTTGLGSQRRTGGVDHAGVSHAARLCTPLGAMAMPYYYLTGEKTLNPKLHVMSVSLVGDTSLMHQKQQNLLHAQQNMRHAHQNLHNAQNQSSRGEQCTSVRAGVGMTTKEPVTGIEFSKTVSPPGSSSELSLVGAGVREKKIAFLKVKVYAVGLYIDASSVEESPLGVWKGKSGSELSKDGAFFKVLVDAPVEKALKMVLARDIDGSQFWGALDEALTPRLKAAAGGSAGEEALASFGNVFKDRALKQGTTVFLTWSQPAALKIAILPPQGSSADAPDATIDSAVLLSCLFDIYFGQNPVAPSAKDAVASGFSSLV